MTDLPRLAKATGYAVYIAAVVFLLAVFGRPALTWVADNILTVAVLVAVAIVITPLLMGLVVMLGNHFDIDMEEDARRRQREDEQDDE